MQLDVKTLYLLNIAVVSVMASVSFFSWLYHRDIPSLLGWAIGLVLGVVGSLVISFHTSASPVVILVIGNTLIIAGYATVWMSIRRFNDGSLKLSYIIVPVSLFAVPFAIACLAGFDMRIGVVMVSAAIGALSLLAAWEVFSARKLDPLTSRLPTAFAFTLIAIAMIVQLGFSLPLAANGTFHDPAQGLTLLINTVCLVAATLGLLMMANERIRHRYEKLASTDELTGLPNRRFFLEHGERLCGRAAQDKSPTCILVMDLDHFSAVNKRFGHAGGDHALATFASFVLSQLRPTDFIARYGGEEFCVLLLKTDMKEAIQIAERLREGVAGMAINLEGRSHRITVSIGLTQLDDGDLPASILKADVALYRAKALGRNLVCSAPAATGTTAAS